LAILCFPIPAVMVGDAVLRWIGMECWGKCQTLQYVSSLGQQTNGKTSNYGADTENGLGW